MKNLDEFNKFCENRDHQMVGRKIPHATDSRFSYTAFTHNRLDECDQQWEKYEGLLSRNDMAVRPSHPTHNSPIL